MVFWLIILFVITPIVEIYVLLQAGSIIGPLPVVAACIFTAILGGWMLRAQGLSTIHALETELRAGQMPVGPLIDSALLLISAPFLMTPGFITDLAGFALLIPASRALIRKYAAVRLQSWADARRGVITIKRS